MTSLNEMFNLVLDEKKGPTIDKSAVMAYQAKNRGTSWDDAVAAVHPAPAKAARKKAAPRAKKVKIMSDKKFEKMMRDTRSDLESDGMDIGDVASDIADSMLYDKDVALYVRHTIARNTGQSPDSVSKQTMKEFLADNIYG